MTCIPVCQAVTLPGIQAVDDTTALFCTKPQACQQSPPAGHAAICGKTESISAAKDAQHVVKSNSMRHIIAWMTGVRRGQS